MVIAQPVDTEQLASGGNGGPWAPMRIIPATRAPTCRQGGCREPATGQHGLCDPHQLDQDRLRAAVLDPGHLTSAELRDMRTHRA